MQVVYSIAAKFAGGGIGTTSYNAVRGISRHGYLKKLFCTSQAPNEIDPSLVVETHAALFDRFPFISQASKYRLKDYWHDKIVARQLSECDIFHVWNGHGLKCLQKAKKQGAVTVVERASSHINTYEKLLVEEYRKWGVTTPVVSPAVKKRLLEEYELADYITVPSEFAYQSMVANGVPKKKLKLLQFGTDLQKFQPNPKKRDNKTFDVLFVGQVGFRKGVLYLLQAWQKMHASNLQGSKLHILGGIESVAEEALKPYRSDKSINFVGYTDPLPYYQKADVFVFPSIEEGSALVTYEAMACGLPQITTFESGSLVEDGKQGFIVPSADVAALVEKLQELYENPKLREKMSKSALAKVRDYSWDDYGDRLVEWYEKIF
ncbi:glycosyltransferase family 4 protein [Candidatus Parcubacteria bacterium]|nr:glycosyltransferase family 4 protein [Candidatus Parcubacteria bacterium]